MNTIKLTIVTPSGEIFNGDVSSINLPGKEGEFGVLPGHSSIVSALSVGVIEIEKNNKKEMVAINWGHVKVSENTVDILVDSAVSLNDSDGSVISSKLKEATKLINSVQDSNASTASLNAKISSLA